MIKPHIADFLPSLYSGPNGTLQFNSINDIAYIIANLIQIMLGLSGILAIIFISYAGIQYIVSQGDPGRVGSAKAGLRNAIVGLVLSAGAYLVVGYLASQFK
jgi:hypothetical protein